MDDKSVPTKTPWYNDAVFYQIYPQSFQDSNGDGIGDLAGIVERLDYLADLGVDAVWLNPVYPSPFRDAGYDVSCYKRIAPRYGDLAKFDRLVREAHKRNIRILMDLVFNHTSDEHPWFRQSQRMKRNRYSKWYVWSGRPEKLRIPGSWAHRVAERHESYYHQFGHHMPDLNFGFPGLDRMDGNAYDDPDVSRLRETLKDVARFWLRRDVDGFRCDVAEVLVRENGVTGLHPNTARFWREIREVVDSFGERAMIAEGWYHLDNIRRGGFTGCFFLPESYQFLSLYPERYEERAGRPRFFSPQGGDIRWFTRRLLTEQRKAAAAGGVVHLISGNHDMMRLRQVARRDDVLKCFFAFLLTYPTAPFVYYGDEIGMPYREDLPSREGAGFRAGSRTPLQWDASRNAGFSSAPAGRLYYPVQSDYRRRNAAVQRRRSGSLLNTVRSLIRLRRSNPALETRSKITHLHLERGSHAYVYMRSGSGAGIVVALNPSDQPRRLSAPVRAGGELSAKTLVPEVSNFARRPIAVNDRLVLDLPSNSFGVFSVRR